MIWNRVVTWFNFQLRRAEMVDKWNNDARNAFVEGFVPFLLKAKIVRGNKGFQHIFSGGYSGFRINVFINGEVTEDLCKIIGTTIMMDQFTIRNLIANGFDTLEIYGDRGGGFRVALQKLLN